MIEDIKCRGVQQITNRFEWTDEVGNKLWFGSLFDFAQMTDSSWSLSLKYRDLVENIIISNNFYTSLAQTSHSMGEEDIEKVYNLFNLQIMKPEDIDEALVLKLVLLATKADLNDISNFDDTKVFLTILIDSFLNYMEKQRNIGIDTSSGSKK